MSNQKKEEQMKDPKNRKVFICFLGTNNYVLCNYCFGNKEENHCVKNVRFVQEAIVRHEFTGWTKNDRIFVFLTDAAKKANWVDGKPSDKDDDEKAKELPNSKWGWQGGEKWGLETQLKKLAKEGLFPEEIIVPVDVEDDSFSEEAFWSLFNKINEQIEPNDEIYLDFTSGFRSLSMFGMVLLTYLKNTKNVSIGEIYYGAFEKLGPVPKVKEMPVEERNAPVLKLKEFSTIMDFSNAANAFVNYGNGRQLCDLLESWRRDLAKNKQQEGIYYSLYGLKNYVQALTLALQTCRGKEIVNADVVKKITDILNSIDERKNGRNDYKALMPIIELIRKKFEAFERESSINNGFVASRWCLENGMYQQCATFLQETIVSYCTKVAGLEYDIEDQRAVAEHYLKRSGGDGDRDPNEWLNKLKEIGFDQKKFDEVATNMRTVDKNLPEPDKSLEQASKLSTFFEKLTKLRNDLNHCGFLSRVTTYSKNKKTGKVEVSSSDNCKPSSGSDFENECKKELKKFLELGLTEAKEDPEVFVSEILGEKLPDHWSEEDRNKIENDLKNAMQSIDSAYARIEQLRRKDENKPILTRTVEEIEEECESKLLQFNDMKEMLGGQSESASN
ncbi:CRISPR-associated protein, TM1812 family [Fibrobacter intestinalis]|uniref:CRISPR-associated protein, TM1812 family n=2 Tax=Fibrobacter intestinalis TaxID=28122 RepID=A0A1M6YI74_9BACT|nr:CRISPR-associated protein, TM1812 family [Fibrobacter intestinalis]